MCILGKNVENESARTNELPGTFELQQEEPEQKIKNKKSQKIKLRLKSQASLSSFTRNKITQWARWAATYPDQPGFNCDPILFLPQVWFV